MLFKVIVIVALSGVAFGQAGQTFAHPPLPSCATSCLQQMQSTLGCDPTLLSCVCPPLVSLVADEQFEECLAANCGATQTGNIGYDLGENCGLYSWPVSTIAASVPMTSSPASTVLNTNPTTTPVTSAPAGAASPTKSANAAARSDVGIVAMGLAIAAAFVL